MHPDPRHAHLTALPHNLLGRIRSGDHHYTVDATRNRLQVRIARLALECVHVRIDGEHFVARALQPLEDEIADRMATVVARHASDRDALLRQKILHLRIERFHGDLLYDTWMI